MHYLLVLSLVCCVFTFTLCHYPEHRHRRHERHHAGHAHHRMPMHGHHHGRSHHHGGYYERQGYNNPDPEKYYETHAVNDNWMEGKEETKVIEPASFISGTEAKTVVDKTNGIGTINTISKIPVASNKVVVAITKTNGASSVKKAVKKAK